MAQESPTRTRMDDAIALIQKNHGVKSIELAAEAFCRSRRQFERVFQETVGISPKLFSQITRFQHATSDAAKGAGSLAN
jgi:methylphosphotriester-DNA--protein-cysteine methyltransferase